MNQAPYLGKYSYLTDISTKKARAWLPGARFKGWHLVTRRHLAKRAAGFVKKGGPRIPLEKRAPGYQARAFFTDFAKKRAPGYQARALKGGT